MQFSFRAIIIIYWEKKNRSGYDRYACLIKGIFNNLSYGVEKKKVNCTK